MAIPDFPDRSQAVRALLALAFGSTTVAAGAAAEAASAGDNGEPQKRRSYKHHILKTAIGLTIADAPITSSMAASIAKRAGGKMGTEKVPTAVPSDITDTTNRVLIMDSLNSIPSGFKYLIQVPPTDPQHNTPVYLGGFDERGHGQCAKHDGTARNDGPWYIAIY